MAHYATFMASRTYLTAGNDSVSPGTSDGVAKTRAEEVFKAFKLSKFGVDTSLEIKSPPSGSGEKYEYTGAKMNFKKPLSMIGFGGGDQILDLVTESFLGREPTRADCYNQLCNVFGVCGENTSNVHITLEDNGC